MFKPPSEVSVVSTAVGLALAMFSLFTPGADLTILGMLLIIYGEILRKETP